MTDIDGPLDIEWSTPDVPTEVFVDHAVMRPPNKLRERAAKLAGPRDTSDVVAISRAESALALLAQEFDGWMAAEVEALENARRALADAPGAETLAALYRIAHDMRGQAATLGFPLAGEIAHGLCELIERSGDAAPAFAVETHVSAIRAIVRENARDREHPLGSALATRLAEMRAELGLTPDPA